MAQFLAVPFYAPYDQSSELSASTSSSTITMIGKGNVLRLINVGTVPARVRYGTATAAQTAVATDLGLWPGVEYLFSCDQSATIYVAAITVSGTTTVSVTRGTGA